MQADGEALTLDGRLPVLSSQAITDLLGTPRRKDVAGVLAGAASR